MNQKYSIASSSSSILSNERNERENIQKKIQGDIIECDIYRNRNREENDLTE